MPNLNLDFLRHQHLQEGTGKTRPYMPDISSANIDPSLSLSGLEGFDFSNGFCSSQQPLSSLESHVEPIVDINAQQTSFDAVEWAGCLDVAPQLGSSGSLEYSPPVDFGGTFQTSDAQSEAATPMTGSFTSVSEVPHPIQAPSSDSSGNERPEPSTFSVPSGGHHFGSGARELGPNSSSPSRTSIHECSVCDRQLKTGRALRYPHLIYPAQDDER